MIKNIVEADEILELLKSIDRISASEIAYKLSCSPRGVIKILLVLESFNHVRQLNGYWYYEPRYITKLTSSNVTDLITLWGPLSVSEITTLLRFTHSEVKEKIRGAVSRKMLERDSQGKYHLTDAVHAPRAS